MVKSKTKEWTPDLIIKAHKMWHEGKNTWALAHAFKCEKRHIYALARKRRDLFPVRQRVKGVYFVPASLKTVKQNDEPLKTPPLEKKTHQKEINRKLRLALMHEHKARRSHSYGRNNEASAHENAANIARRQASELESGV